jgi:hypothetical protein
VFSPPRPVRPTLAWLVGAVILLPLTAFPRSSQAQVAASNAGVHLSWTRSPEALACPDAGRVQADVVRRLRRSPFSEPSSVFVEASISKSGELWQAEIEMRDAEGASLGSRRVESDSANCTSLASAAGLAIALMIDPDALLEPTPATPPPAPPPAQPDPAPGVPPVEPAAQRPRRLALVASLLLVSRALPRPALGGRLATELRLVGRLDASLALAVLAERRGILRGEDVSFGLLWGGLGPCYRLIDSATVKLSGCATFLFGALRSVVFDPSRARTSQLPWAAAAAGVRVGVSPLGPLQLDGGVDLMTPLYRRDYLVERAPGDHVSVFSDPALAGAAFVGVGVQY